jgi:hypothetical protein
MADVSGGKKEYSAIWALVIAGVVFVGVLGAAVGLLILLAHSPASGPEAALSLVFVAAAVVLILVVCTLTIVFKRLGIFDPDEAMGLPRGSVRAVIALLLILLFFIAAIFLFSSTKNQVSDEPRKLTDISADRFGEIPTEEIESVESRTVGDATLYTVTLSPKTANTTTSDDIAKQLVTTVATLVTAVAAFYFGANAVAAAHKEALIQPAPDPNAPDPNAPDPNAPDPNAPDPNAGSEGESPPTVGAIPEDDQQNPDLLVGEPVAEEDLDLDDAETNDGLGDDEPEPDLDPDSDPDKEA